MIDISDLHKKFQQRVIFDGFNLHVDSGEFVGLFGKSGAGKTTLLNIVGSIEPFESGEIQVDDYPVHRLAKRQLAYLREKVGFMFQNFALIDQKTVKENLSIFTRDSRSGMGMKEALDFAGLDVSEDQRVYTLSGGEQQRLAVARLLMKKCDVILADEPTGSLDPDNAKAICSLLSELNRMGKTILLVTHDTGMPKAIPAMRPVYL